MERGTHILPSSMTRYDTFKFCGKGYYWGFQVQNIQLKEPTAHELEQIFVIAENLIILLNQKKL